MVIEVALLSVIVLVVAAIAKWAFLPTRHLPCNRVRYMRFRLHLRLHPGKGFAHVFSLWLRWGRLAALRRSGRIRPSLPMLLPLRRSAPARGVPGPRSLPAWPARSAGGAPAGDGAAADVQDRVPG